MRGVQVAAIENLRNMGYDIEVSIGGRRTGFLLDLCREVAEAVKETIQDVKDDDKLDFREKFDKINDIIDVGSVVLRYKEAKDDMLYLSESEVYANEIEQAVKLALEDDYSPFATLRSPASILNWVIYSIKMVVDIKHDLGLK